VVLVGAFRWVVKQNNLRALVRHAVDAFAQHGIVLDLVGDVPEPLRSELAPHANVLRVHGFVDDLRPLLADARMALVPEAVGGGFKLKMLDYVFHRVPVVTLSDAAAGLPAVLRGAMRECPDLPALVDAVVQGIDDVATLDRMQQAAFDAAQRSFDWADRGRALLAAMRAQALVTPRSLSVSEGPEAGQAHSSRYSNAQFSGDSRYPPITSQPMNSTTRTEIGAAIRVRQ
jgi:glycosyltransferase involved in cell wall biosynthesis